MEERIRQLEAKLEEQARINDELRNEKSFLEGECNRLAGELKAAEESKNMYRDWYNKEEVKKSEALLVLSSVSGILTAYLGKNK